MSGIGTERPNVIRDLRIRLETLEAEPVNDHNAALAVVLRADIEGIHALTTPLVWRVLDPMLDRLNRMYPEQKPAASE